MILLGPREIIKPRGFLIGATSGRTTLPGEGLQHGDGHSHIMASVIPNCKSYDPTFAYELAIIFREGLEKNARKTRKYFLLHYNYE